MAHEYQYPLVNLSDDLPKWLNFLATEETDSYPKEILSQKLGGWCLRHFPLQSALDSNLSDLDLSLIDHHEL